ncbi:RNA 2',3'-cyclic phosphodiesterase [Pleomorphomonas sp. T1.2MG-36]|uniref:2'-5' RNA ligase family protein n=1 Tax=Pleomorphomonas sp. T1.2MG-36 TaxID=3041167 RepID=UPI00247751FA|nr:2'-5' RNA ligase family protein [Pleomorphomonas sp. T1.2MG-36]CAI9404599.1 RNA 2',3'-cyclic phosphodiesterase [Pleomorphomonas sp. T1.2MG-36]
MPYAICIKCLNDTAAPILKLWDEASAFEVTASMTALNYPPHLTLAVFPDHPGRIVDGLDEVFAAQPKLTIAFDGVAYFDNDLLVLWARPRRNDALMALHEKLHRHIAPALCDPHYREGNWVPHCSLATKVPRAEVKAAIAWARQKRLDFKVEFDTADFVEFPPVRVERSYRLR